jgi:predicted nucleic acid-binding protein
VGSSSSPTTNASPPAAARSRPTPSSAAGHDANDSWIAACCLVRDLPLATFNIKDFADFAEHEGLELVH